MTFDWAINGISADQIKNVCFTSDVKRVTSVTKVRELRPDYGWGWGTPMDDVSCSGGVKDDDLTQATYEQIYGLRKTTFPDDSGTTYIEALGQSFYRYHDKSWDGKSLSGTFSTPVIGLTPNTTYGNNTSFSAWGDVDSIARNELAVGQTKTVDIRSFYVSLRIELKDGLTANGANYIASDYNPAKVPDFTTTAEPAGTAEDKLTPETKDNVTVDNSGKVEAGKSARIYINDLKENCKADGASCFWYGYIYSDPTKLTGPDGSPFLTVKKDDAGKYYVDAFIPDGFSGEHKIALTDETGTLQGWTDVTVDRGKTSPFTDVIKGKTPHFDEILWLADQGISTGWKQPDGTTTFAPQADVNRQDMAAFLYRLAGSPEFDETKAKNPFADVTEKTPHYKEILWLASTGITTGYTQADGTVRFEGLAGVQRQDMAAFLHRLADYAKAPAPTGEDKSFTDVDEKTPHAEDIAWLAKTGVTTGYEDGTFGGSRIVIRQDMAAFLQRMKTNVLK